MHTVSSCGLVGADFGTPLRPTGPARSPLDLWIFIKLISIDES